MTIRHTYGEVAFIAVAAYINSCCLESNADDGSGWYTTNGAILYAGFGKMRLKKNELLRRLEQFGETPTGFATRCGVSRQAMSAWINGTRFPKPPNVKTMAEKLRCGIEDIAEPRTQLENVALHGDKFARSILGMESAADKTTESGDAINLDRKMLDFVKKQFAEQAQSITQTALGKRLGLSASQINRLIHGKAEFGSLPISVLSKLCPALINRDILTGVATANMPNGETASLQGRLFVSDDPFLQIILEKWKNISFEDRGRLAGIVSGMSEKTPVVTAPETAISPKYYEKITKPHESGNCFECQECGQHLKSK